jgi:cupin fold WbuC family metalloprotein
MIERIEDKGRLYALVVRHDYEPEGVNFVTTPEDTMQVGVLKHPGGTVIKPHVHKGVSRTIAQTQEVLLIHRGKVLVKFYDDEGHEVAHVTLNGGDAILLLAGGHGLDILEDTKMMEVKQGPYYGFEQDKVRLKQ